MTATCDVATKHLIFVEIANQTKEIAIAFVCTKTNDKNQHHTAAQIDTKQCFRQETTQRERPTDAIAAHGRAVDALAVAMT